MQLNPQNERSRRWLGESLKMGVSMVAVRLTNNRLQPACVLVFGDESTDLPAGLPTRSSMLRITSGTARFGFDGSTVIFAA